MVSSEYKFVCPPATTGTVWLPITSQNAPLNTNSPPSVIMKAGMRCRTISAPMAVHNPKATTTLAPSAATAGQPWLKINTLAMPPIRPTPLPTDRSMCPGKITSSIPRARVAVMASSTASMDKLRAERNCGAATAKNPPITKRLNSREKSRSVSFVFISGCRAAPAHCGRKQALGRGF